MELRLESRTVNQAIDEVAQFFEQQRVVACLGDRFALSCLCLAEPIRRSVVGVPPRKRRALSWCCAPGPAC